MSKITLTPNASGTGTFTIQSPATDTNRTFTLPDADGELSVSITSANDPAADSNPAGGVGTVWTNSTSGKMYVLTDATEDANVWTASGGGGGGISSRIYHEAEAKNSFLKSGIFIRKFHETSGIRGGFYYPDTVNGGLRRQTTVVNLTSNATENSTTVVDFDGGGTITSNVAFSTATKLKDTFVSSSYGDQYSTNSMTFTFDFSSPVEVNNYIVRRFSAGWEPDYWTFQYSTNGSTWTTLDSHSQTSNWSGEYQDIDVTVTTARYFRFNFTGGAGTPSVGYVIKEIRINGPVPVDPTYTSQAFSADEEPSKIKLSATVNTENNSPVSGTDLEFEVSRDGGTTYTILPFTVTDFSAIRGDTYDEYLLEGEVDVSSQPSGTDVKFRAKYFDSSTNEPRDIKSILVEWE